MSAETITTTPERKLQEGDTIYFLRAVTGWGDIRHRGYERRLTAADIAATINREGVSWLDEIDAEGARIGRGPWPTGEPTWTYGGPDWEEAREGARRRAWVILDPAGAAARQAVEDVYGPAPSTSNTLSAPNSSPEQRAAEEQRSRTR